MSPHQRKKAFNRGTFLLVDGEKYDVSNIVHESTELIPDEVTVVIRRCTWADQLYPRLDSIEAYLENEIEEQQQKQQQFGRADSESSQDSSDDDDDDDDETDDSSSLSSGRFAAEASWNHQQHQSLASMNWIPPEKAELLKMVERSGGPAQVPGAVHVGNESTAAISTAYSSPKKPPPPLKREESTPGAVHVDGPGVKYGEISREQSRRESQEDTKLGPSYAHAATKRSSFSIDPYFSDNRPSWEEQHHCDDDSWCSGQIKAAAAAFDNCDIAPPSEPKRMVQVTDTLELPLHGANETTVALETGNAVTVVCVVCRATLRCISIAQYVLCPECRCLTPLEDTHSAKGGVGLGLLSTYDQSFRVGVS